MLSGETYLHNRSGARKSSGSYYTKPFAVEHLLKGALEPALSDHFERLDGMDETDAAMAFFDFRVADIAMGSGHFLIGAIDHIEKRMAGYLAKRSLQGVRWELAKLRAAAREELGELGENTTIEDGQLLRRMIAGAASTGSISTSCRSSSPVSPSGSTPSCPVFRSPSWITTWRTETPWSGSALWMRSGRNSRNSLLTTALGQMQLAFLNPDALIGKAAKPLARLANFNDASLQEIAAAREAARDARKAIRSTEALCDLIGPSPSLKTRK